MIDWYYHDPGEGRVGPYSAEELRKRFRERRIERDTLVWHQGLREWQPLERMGEELGLDQVQPDASRPPPLPGAATAIAMPTSAAPTATARAAARGKYARSPLREKKTLPTGAIVAIAIVVLAIPALALLSSILLPAYNRYFQQAQNIGAIEGLADPLKQAVEDYALRRRSCPHNRNPQVRQMAEQIRQLASIDVRFGSIEGGCMFELALSAKGDPHDGKTVRYAGYRNADAFVWDCSGGDLPDAYRPVECRSR